MKIQFFMCFAFRKIRFLNLHVERLLPEMRKEKVKYTLICKHVEIGTLIGLPIADRIFIHIGDRSIG